MSHIPRPLIGSVFERNQLSTPAAPSSSKTTATGFPAVQHRSKSAFARNREKNIAGGKASARLKEPPLVSTASAFTTAPAHAQSPNGADASDDDWLRQVGEENARKVASMTDAEREAEKREIEEKFGSGIGEILRRAKEAREARERDMERDTGSKHVSTVGMSKGPYDFPSSRILFLIINCSRRNERVSQRSALTLLLTPLTKKRYGFYRIFALTPTSAAVSLPSPHSLHGQHSPLQPRRYQPQAPLRRHHPERRARLRVRPTFPAPQTPACAPTPDARRPRCHNVSRPVDGAYASEAEGGLRP